jgi:hypothetical protein
LFAFHAPPHAFDHTVQVSKILLGLVVFRQTYAHFGSVGLELVDCLFIGGELVEAWEIPGGGEK